MKSKLKHEKILDLINSTDHPLHTQEIARRFPNISDFRVKNALIRLMSDGQINGRLLDVAKGIWIWWRKDAFKKEGWVMMEADD